MEPTPQHAAALAAWLKNDPPNKGRKAEKILKDAHEKRAQEVGRGRAE